MLKYEPLIQWAREEWQARYPKGECVSIWAASECANFVAQQQVKPGRRLTGKARYRGAVALDCPHVMPIADYGSRGNQMVLTSSAGAFAFQFEDDDGTPFEVIYVCKHFADDSQELSAVAAVPADRLQAWASFEMLCRKAVRPRIKRRRDMYIIGGNDAFFDPTVEWADVILSEALKAKLHDDIEAFFNNGVEIYRQLKLPPFRKLLLAGVPGTGKTMLCAALAKIAIKQRRVVVYVSGADRDGASFEKIQRALHAVTAARFPVLLIVEEMDAYLQGDDKARVLNVLDGIESPNNPRGALLLATTNYPEAIDERIAKRPGRLDRIFIVPPIEDESQAQRMLKHYMGDQWRPEHEAVVSDLIDQPGAFVREVALHARMLAAHERLTSVSLEMLERSVQSLQRQLRAERDFLAQRRPISMTAGNHKKKSNNSPFGFGN